MRILCRHGHYSFYPRNEYEVYIFNDLYDADLVRCGDYYTFSLLKDAENYSLIGKNYLNLPAIARYQGNPWEVMRENGFVYNVGLKLLTPKELVTIKVNPKVMSQYYLPDTLLIQAGSFNIINQRIMSYDAEFIQENNQLRILELSYE